MTWQHVQPPPALLALRAMIACVVSLLMLITPAAAGDGDEAFKAGVEALRDRRFVQAISLLLEARARDGRESMRKVRTKWLVGGEPYLPWYFVGVAYATLGNCHGAVTAFEHSEKQNVIVRDRDRYADLLTRKQACVAAGVLPEPQFTQQLTQAERLVGAAQRASSAISGLSERYPNAWRPELARAYARASTDVKSAASKLSSGRVSGLAIELADARAFAESALVDLQPLKANLDGYAARVESNARALDDAGLVLGDLEALEVEIGALLADAAARAALPPELAQREEEMRTQVASLRARIEAVRGAGADDVRSDLLSVAETLRERLRGLQAEARAAVSRLLTTQFDAALRQTEKVATDMEAALAGLDRRLSGATDLSSQARARMTADRDKVHRQLDEAKRGVVKARDSRAPGELRRVRIDLSAAQAGLRAVENQLAAAAQTSLPAALTTAVELFSSGAYERVLAELPDNGIALITDRRWRLHARLFRAAALFSLGERRGDGAVELRTRAEHEVALCRELDGEFEPDEATFSPQFRSFYGATSRRRKSR